jgi:Restriction alleviation protein Lar
MNEELKPCAHCGDAAYLENCITEIVIRCTHCPAQMQGFWSSEEAINYWNRRA